MTKKIVILCTSIMILFIIIPFIYQLGWEKDVLKNLTQEQSDSVLEAYDLVITGKEHVESFSRICYMDDVYFVIEITGAENVESLAAQNTEWETQKTSFSLLNIIFPNRRYSSQRIYIDGNRKILVSCFHENKKAVKELFSSLRTS